MKRILTYVALAAIMIIPRAASASSILYFADMNLGTNQMEAALASTSHTVTTAASTSQFTTLLATNSYDLAIFFQQNSAGGDYDAAFAALGTYISGGGAAIAGDWTQDDAHLALFDAQATGSANQSAMTVTDAQLIAGVVNPVSLTNPGWGIYSLGLTALSGGTSAAAFANGDTAIVIGNGGRSIFNGFLADTVDGSGGRQLFLNEIGAALGSQSPTTAPVPEPASMVLLGTGLIGAGIRRYRRQ